MGQMPTYVTSQTASIAKKVFGTNLSRSHTGSESKNVCCYYHREKICVAIMIELYCSTPFFPVPTQLHNHNNSPCIKARKLTTHQRPTPLTSVSNTDDLLRVLLLALGDSYKIRFPRQRRLQEEFPQLLYYYVLLYCHRCTLHNMNIIICT